MVKTVLCDMLGITHPIIQAGMGPYSTNRLAAAAANAGVLGVISTSGYSYVRGGARGGAFADLVGTLTDDKGGSWYDQVKRAFHRVKEQTRESQGIFGINCMVSAEMAYLARDIIRAVSEVRQEDPEMKERLRVIITSAGDPLPWTDIIKPIGVRWFHVVPSVRHAIRSQRAGVDAVIASGQEGGGHVAWEPVHTMVLLRAVVQEANIPVIGAGGFGDGASLIAALALGAAGVQMGTRFLATRESDFPQMHKEYIVKSGERDTIVARGFVGPLRWVRNEAAMELAKLTVSRSPGLYLGQPDDMATASPEVMSQEREGFEAFFRHDGPKALMPGGEIAGTIKDIPTVRELVDRIAVEAGETLRTLCNKYPPS